MSYESVEHQLVEMANDGALSFEKIALACLAFMSEDDICEMARAEELIDYTEEELSYQVRCDFSGKLMYTSDNFDYAEREAELIAKRQDRTMTVFEVSDNGGHEKEMDSYYP